jgi:hypothetical protein
MPINLGRQQVLKRLPITASERVRTLHAVRDARQRRAGQGALAGSILRLTGLRRFTPGAR